MDINDERYWSTSFFDVSSVVLEHGTLDSGTRVLTIKVKDSDGDAIGDITFFNHRREPIALRFKES